MRNLEELKNLIDEEIQLYRVLDTQFEEKRKILISNNADELLKIDEKILNTVDEIKSAVYHRQTVSKLVAGKDLSLSEMISAAKESAPELAGEFEIAKDQIAKLSEEIARKERIIKELLRHGMNLVNKTLNLISNAASIAGDYNRTGKNVQSSIDRISSIVEEV